MFIATMGQRQGARKLFLAVRSFRPLLNEHPRGQPCLSRQAVGSNGRPCQTSRPESDFHAPYSIRESELEVPIRGICTNDRFSEISSIKTDHFRL